ncbi:MAG: bifunctional 4-hydroxy-2-oxoglutarate aldolase/2-dehydro-3-deoxy-phosphogluconate aldolase [Alphaproteobacteria bacterium]|jgi:2-dehydro-3-deoxyphosphogluconate aldolase/(4S)-4-hydroxy-2-oxoglutarate aldolase
MPKKFELPNNSPPIIPVVVIENAAKAPDLARALLAGGIKSVEVTLRSPAAIDAIRAISTLVPEIVLGAGTILSPNQMDRAAKAGASFFVSPGATNHLIDAAIQFEQPFLFGASTASEAMALREHGYRRLKFFPAESAGGKSTLKGLEGPLPDLSFCPTGGINQTNAEEYLTLPNVFSVGGSWIAPSNLIEAGAWAEITSLAQTASRLATKI